MLMWLSLPLLLLTSHVASAQPGSEPPLFRALRLVGGHEIVVTRAFRTDAFGPRARVTVRGPRNEIVCYDGTPVEVDVTARDGVVLIALVGGGRQPSVRLVRLPVQQNGDLGAARNISVPRTAVRSLVPWSAIVGPAERGFVVLWQEVMNGNPQADVASYMGTLDLDGNWINRPSQVQIPWALAAIAWNGHGYHLALYYSTGQPDGTTLAMVTLSAVGQPLEHPWWASAPGSIYDVQLVRAPPSVPCGGSCDPMAVFFRGGPTGEELFSLDTSTPGQWGTSPTRIDRHGAIGDDEDYTVRATERGPEVLRRRM